MTLACSFLLKQKRGVTFRCPPAGCKQQRWDCPAPSALNDSLHIQSCDGMNGPFSFLPAPPSGSLTRGFIRFRPHHVPTIGAPGLISMPGRYRLPLDVVLLGLVVCAMAQADRSDTVEITLYAPMRRPAAGSSSWP